MPTKQMLTDSILRTLLHLNTASPEPCPGSRYTLTEQLLLDTIIYIRTYDPTAEDLVDYLGQAFSTLRSVDGPTLSGTNPLPPLGDLPPSSKC